MVPGSGSYENSSSSSSSSRSGCFYCSSSGGSSGCGAEMATELVDSDRNSSSNSNIHDGDCNSTPPPPSKRFKPPWLGTVVPRLGGNGLVGGSWLLGCCLQYADAAAAVTPDLLPGHLVMMSLPADAK